MGSFAEQIARFGANTVADIDVVVRGSVEEVGQRLVDNSPVDTTAFQSNWNYSAESPDRFFSATRLKVRAVNGVEDLPQRAASFIHYIVNGAPYGPALERGHSQQAPQGVVGLRTLEWESIVGGQVLKVQR